jgi:hypothetical protein
VGPGGMWMLWGRGVSTVFIFLVLQTPSFSLCPLKNDP